MKTQQCLKKLKNCEKLAPAQYNNGRQLLSVWTVKTPAVRSYDDWHFAEPK